MMGRCWLRCIRNSHPPTPNTTPPQLQALRAGISQRESALLAARNALGDAEAAHKAAVQEMRRAKDSATENFPPTEHDK